MVTINQNITIEEAERIRKEYIAFVGERSDLYFVKTENGNIVMVIE
jgi:hypothetical protein